MLAPTRDHTRFLRADFKSPFRALRISRSSISIVVLPIKTSMSHHQGRNNIGQSTITPSLMNSRWAVRRNQHFQLEMPPTLLLQKSRHSRTDLGVLTTWPQMTAVRVQFQNRCMQQPRELPRRFRRHHMIVRSDNHKDLSLNSL